MCSIVVKSFELHRVFLFSASYQSIDFLLKLVRLHLKQKGGAEYLIEVICSEWMLDNNSTNRSLNELFNFFNSWSLIDCIAWVSSVVLDAACLRSF